MTKQTEQPIRDGSVSLAFYNAFRAAKRNAWAAHDCACGKRISGNKQRCLACQTAFEQSQDTPVDS